MAQPAENNDQKELWEAAFTYIHWVQNKSRKALTPHEIPLPPSQSIPHTPAVPSLSPHGTPHIIPLRPPLPAPSRPMSRPASPEDELGHTENCACDNSYRWRIPSEESKNLQRRAAQLLENRDREELSEENLLQILDACLDSLPQHPRRDVICVKSDLWKSMLLDAIQSLPLASLPYEPVPWPVTPVGLQQSASTRLPPELFDSILFHASIRSKYDEYAGIGAATKACSLVCRHWAHRCRRYLFFKKTLKITSFKQATTFVEYMLRGSPSLVPLFKLIKGIRVCQSYRLDSERSFCHLFHLYKAKFGLRLMNLEIEDDDGWRNEDIPEVPSQLLGTPHWGLPPSAVTSPSLLPYEEITLSDIRLPSFACVAKYIRHFGNASVHTVSLWRVTWDTSRGETPLPCCHRKFSRLTLGSLHVQARDCTNNLLPCVQIAETHPRSLMRALSDAVRQWIYVTCGWFREWLERCWREYSFGSDRCAFTSEQRGPLSTQTITVSVGIASDSDSESLGCYLTFTLDRSASPNTTTSGYLFIVGCVLIVEIDVSEFPRDDLDLDVEVEDLMTYLGQHFEMLNAIVFVFDWYSDLRLVMERHRPVLFDADTTRYTYLFVCRRIASYDDDEDDDEDNIPFISSEVPEPDGDWKWVGINPITLAPTGQFWKNKEDIMPSFLSSNSKCKPFPGS